MVNFINKILISKKKFYLFSLIFILSCGHEGRLKKMQPKGHIYDSKEEEVQFLNHGLTPNNLDFFFSKLNNENNNIKNINNNNDNNNAEENGLYESIQSSGYISFNTKKNTLDSSNIDKNNEDKSLKTLINELELENKNNDQLKTKIKGIEQIIIAAQNTYTQKSKIIKSSLTINNWTKEDIQKWSTLIKKKKIDINLYLPEVLAVIKKAVKDCNLFFPRNAQYISLLSLWFKNKNLGRLAQIYTGEGKSLIIAMLAILNVFKGKKVDVVTSSELLATRDAKDKSELYSYFNMKTAHNYDLFNVIKKECYKADIVYGDAFNYQGDILYDRFKGYETRCGRRFEDVVVIVDEVDNMLIDKRLHSTLISSQIPGMSVLTPVLETIWQIINTIIDNIPKDIVELDPYKFVDQYINKTETQSIQYFMESCVPKYLKKYALSQLIEWCFNASFAKMYYKKNIHYVIENKKIIPVDFNNTGTWLWNTVWGNGLHQFLQIKHDLPVTSINLTTNFLSNVSFFKFYPTIFGLSGTMGSQSEQNLLKRIYSLDTIQIPSFKHRKLKEIPGILCRNKERWLNVIYKRIIQETDNGRAVLVISETISDVLNIEKVLKTNFYKNELINTFKKGNEEEQEVFKRKLKPGEIVIATNLAGRGTDLKISKEVETKGGLYVCLTFMPENIRIEEQAFGRAGRKGKEGSGQIIINMEEKHMKNKYSKCKSIYEIKILRDKKEKESLKFAYNETIKVINKDKLFNLFCELHQKISELTNKDKDIISALEERWGLWLLSLDENELKKTNFDDIKPLFNEFKNKILKDFDEGKIILNPKYYLRQGHVYFEKGKYPQALKLFKTSSELNELDWIPKYFSSFTNLKLNNKKEGKKELIEAAKLLTLEEAQYRAVQLYGNRPALQRIYKIENVNKNNRKKSIEKLMNIETSNSSNSTSTRFNRDLEMKSLHLKNIHDLLDRYEQNDIKNFRFVNIEEIYNAESDKDKVDSLKVDGYIKMAVVKKVRPYFPIVGTIFMSFLEIGGGIALAMTGIGLPWSTGLIIEGFSDIFCAYKIFKTNTFNVQFYMASKVLSIALIGSGIGLYSNIKGIGQSITQLLTAGSGVIFKGKLYGKSISYKAKKEEFLKNLKQKEEKERQAQRFNNFIDQFREDIQNEEYDKFEKLCIDKIRKLLKSELNNILNFLIFIPDFDKLMLIKYKQVQKSKLEKLVSSVIGKSNLPITTLTNSANRAFDLLEKSEVMEKFINAFKKELQNPDFIVYNKISLINELMKLILKKKYKKLKKEIANFFNREDIESEEEIEETEEEEDEIIFLDGDEDDIDVEDEKDDEKEENDVIKNKQKYINVIPEEDQVKKLGHRHTELTKQRAGLLKKIKKISKKSKERIKLNAELVNMDIEIYEINDLKKQITDHNEMVEKIENIHEFNNLVQDCIDLLDKKVFVKSENFIFNVKSKKIADIHEHISEILKNYNPLIVEPFVYIYTSFLGKEDLIDKALSVIIKKSSEGHGSIIQSFFNEYLKKTINGASDKFKSATLQNVSLSTE